ncbi:hypothetical protein [Wenxinia saemankumensis]|uniref:Uncharacterized protein n=1 Tax=Wenxinia saemankumensis TaxID=1447782 RepID=A0A1M6E8T6_9RHOB|nr:hypothetical protein [Wenxinia saemankumensis]SHI81944.1 hypothetical protein SAMN05444417_1877 [Wenxinia saemankumensis]
MSPFDRIVAIDWSARAGPSPRRPSPDAIFLCERGPGGADHPVYLRTRDAAMEAIHDILGRSLAAGEKVLVGFDFAFGFPPGFARALTGRAEALAVWDWLAARVQDGPDNANDRFEVAAELNAFFPGEGPFWGHPPGRSCPGLPRLRPPGHGRGLPPHRLTEGRAPGAQSVWKLYTTGAVGSQTLLGLPRLAALRRRYGPDLSVWPMESGWRVPGAPITLNEIYPGLLRRHDPAWLVEALPEESYAIPDARQVRAVVDHLADLPPAALAALFGPPAGLDGDAERVAREEGWILGVDPGPGSETGAGTGAGGGAR